MAISDFSGSSFTLGILGGGQLGRMLLQRTVDFNISTAVMDGDASAPCRFLCERFEHASFADFDAVYRFGKTVSMLTVEIEHVNTAALLKLQQEGLPVFPQPELLEMIKDKGLQKEFYRNHNIPTAPFYLINGIAEFKSTHFPVMMKLRKGGYDGKGVMKILDASMVSGAFNAPCVVEEAIDFKKEIAVIVARNQTGDVVAYPACEMKFSAEANLVEYLFAPADISEKVETEARSIALRIIDELKLVGLLAVEMFITKEDDVLVNEIAPRPHNSGHHTIEANMTSQYEQHLRCLLNMPLGQTAATCPAAMINLLGEKGFEGNACYEGLEKVLAIEGVHIHLYGKKTTRPFRKMGHITITGKTVGEARAKAELVQSLIKVKGSVEQSTSFS